MRADLFKVLGADLSSFHGGTGRWTVNRWRHVKPPLRACSHGLHVVTVNQLPAWLGPTIWRVEVEGARLDEADKIVVERARITTRCDGWNEVSARLFAADCAEHVLPIFEKARPNDDRPRKAIEAARAFARDEIGDAAWAAAWAAARAAAWAAARITTAAARDAAWAAERAWQADKLAVLLEVTR